MHIEKNVFEIFLTQSWMSKEKKSDNIKARMDIALFCD
jgi:hypothetical protein